MVVSILAPVAASSGSAIAATKLVNGNKLIAKHSLSGNRLQNKTITGTEVNLKKLGTVPNATNATNAINVVHAGFIQASAGQTVPVASFGPFTLKLDCENNGSGSYDGVLQITTSAPNSEVQANPMTPGATYTFSDPGTSTSYQQSYLQASDAADAAGDAHDVVYNVGEYFPGATGNCFTWVTAQKS